MVKPEDYAAPSGEDRCHFSKKKGEVFVGLENAKIQELYETEYPALFRIACGSGLGRTFADDMVQETFQTLLERRDDPRVAEHENLEGWLIVTLRNKIATEMQRKWRQMEQPLTELSATAETGCELSFRDLLPRQLSKEEKDLLCMYYEVRLSHREIGQILGISEAASRMRLIRARNSYEKWKKYEEETEKMLLHSVPMHKYESEEVLGCPKRKEHTEAASRAL